MQSWLSCSATNLLDGAEIVAEMQIAGRLDAGKDERLEGGHWLFLLACGGPFRARRKSFDGALMDHGEGDGKQD